MPARDFWIRLCDYSASEAIITSIAHQLRSCGIMFQIPLQAVRSVFAVFLIFNTVDVGLNSDNPDIIIVLPIKVARCGRGIAVYCSIQKKCSYVRDDYGYSFIDDTW